MGIEKRLHGVVDWVGPTGSVSLVGFLFGTWVCCLEAANGQV